MHPIYIRVLALFLAICAIAGCSSSGSMTEGRVPSGGVTYKHLSSERKIVLNESRKWLGTPYKYGGKSRAGTDCSGFVYSVYSTAGVSLPRRARDMYSVGVPVNPKKILPGDLVFFKNTAGSGITHVGIYTGRAQFIHASATSGVVTSSLNHTYYNKHFAGARKILK